MLVLYCIIIIICFVSLFLHKINFIFACSDKTSPDQHICRPSEVKCPFQKQDGAEWGGLQSEPEWFPAGVWGNTTEGWRGPGGGGWLWGLQPWRLIEEGSKQMSTSWQTGRKWPSHWETGGRPEAQWGQAKSGVPCISSSVISHK